MDFNNHVRPEKIRVALPFASQSTLNHISFYSSTINKWLNDNDK